jgi:hypothetical protein
MAVAGGCGSRTDLDFLSSNGVAPGSVPPPPPGNVPPSQDGGLNVVILPGDDGGIVYAADGAVLGTYPGSNAVNGAPTPHCIVTSTCNYEEVSAGYGWAVGTFSVETISVTCQQTPTIVQQAMNGAWVTLEAYHPVASDDPSWDQGIYDTSAPSSIAKADPPTGAPVASVQAIRACFYDTSPASGGFDCDPTSFITVSNCFTCPHKNCGIGNFLDEACQCAKNVPPIFPHGMQ